MTGFAVVAEAARVRIIATVTGRTAAVDYRFLTARASVAVVAGQRNMGTGQCEISVRVVIKGPGTPGRWIVAIATLAAESAVVRIVLFMAVETGIAGISKCSRRMALVATDIGMNAE